MRVRALIVLLIAVGAAISLGWWAIRSVDRPEGLPSTDRTGEETEGSGGNESAHGHPREALRGPNILEGLVRRDGEPAVARVTAILAARSSDAKSLGSTLTVGGPDPDAAFRETTSDEDGRFRIPDLPDGSYLLQARAEDGARASSGASFGMPVPRDPVVLHLVATPCSLHGRAVRPDGRPWSGLVRVSSGGKGAFIQSWPGVRPDPDGRFAFDELPAGPARLLAIEPDRLEVGPTIELPHPDPVTFVVGEGRREVTGTVVRAGDGRPVPGAVVVAYGGDETRDVMVRAHADDTGAFRFHPPAGQVQLTVGADGFASWTGWVKEDASEVTARLERLGGIHGRVTDPDGRPLAGVPVLAIAGMSAPRRAITDSEGRYVLDGVWPGRTTLMVWGGGWVSRKLLALEGPLDLEVDVPPRAPVERDLVATRAGSVAGVVLEGSGEPAAGATVRVEVDLTGGDIWLCSILQNLESSNSTTTTADGRFAFDTLVPAGAYRIEARSREGVPGSAGPFSVAAGDARQVEIRLPATRWLDVLVLEKASRAPIVGARIGISLLKGGSHQGVGGSWRTDERGQARAGPLPVGRLSVGAEREGYARPLENATVDDPAATAVTVTLEKGRLLAGTVRLPDGSPGADAHVSTEKMIRGVSRSLFVRDRASPSGAFRLENLPSGSIRLSVYLERDDRKYRLTTDVESGREDLVLTLVALPPSERRFSLRVRDAQGRPVPRAQASFRTISRSGYGGSGETVEDGVARERFPHAAGRERWIEVHGARDAAGEPLPLGAALHGPIPDGVNELDLVLPAERRIEGVVRGPDGKGVSGVVIRCRAVYDVLKTRFGANRSVDLPPMMMGGAERGAEHAIVRTDEDGRFSAGGLADIGYLVFADVPEAYVAPASTSVRAGARDVAITLTAARRVRIRLLDHEGRPVAGASVVVSQRTENDLDLHGPRGFRGRSDAQGVATIEGLAPGIDCVVNATPPRERRDLLRLRVPRWSPEDATFRFERAYRIRGVVRDGAGRPVHQALVRCRIVDRGGGKLARTDEAGRFEFGALPEGRISLRTTDRDADVDAVPETIVDAAVGEVNLTLDPGLAIEVRISNWPESRKPWVRFLVEGAEEVIQREVRDGVVRLTGLAAGARATLFVPAERGGKVLLLAGLAAGAAPVEASLADGGTIAGRIILPPGAFGTRVSVRVSGHLVWGKVEASGTFEVGGLPAGTWPLTARTRVNGEEARCKVTVSVGESIEVVLR